MYRVMIVDDDKWALADIKRSFAFEKYNFEGAGEFLNAEEALVGILQAPPDLIISDIRMQRNSGLDLARTLREQGIHSLFVLLSGYDDFSYVQDAFRFGVFYYMLKPIDDLQAEQLMQRILVVLNIRQPNTPHGYTDDLLGKALRYIDTHYQTPLSLDDVANELHISKNYLSDLISKRLGMPFTQYKQGLRILKAQQMIANGGDNLTQIALQIGFDSLSHFSKVFKQVTGLSPQQYKQQSSLHNN